jgi:hypothetical protein
VDKKANPASNIRDNPCHPWIKASHASKNIRPDSYRDSQKFVDKKASKASKTSPLLKPNLITTLTTFQIKSSILNFLKKIPELIQVVKFKFRIIDKNKRIVSRQRFAHLKQYASQFHLPLHGVVEIHSSDDRYMGGIHLSLC